MSKRLNELRHERGQAITEARRINDKAFEEKRSMTEEEDTNYKAAMKKAGDIKEAIEREETLIEEERALAGQAANNPNNPGDNGKAKTPEERQLSAFRSFLCHGYSDMTAEEKRDLQIADSTKGGNIVAPQAFVSQLIKDLDNMIFLRGWATVIPGGANGVGIPTLDADVDDADWTTELATGNEDDAMRFGKRAMAPNPMAKRVKASNDLLMNSALGAENIVRQRLAYKFGVTQEKAYLTGNGNKQPLGIFTASNDGIPTSRDLSTGNSTTAIAADNLISQKYNIKAPYRAKAKWMFHRDGIAQVAKLKDGENRYLWQPGLVEGQPDRLLNMPVAESEYVPNTFTTGQYVGILGDFSHYWILDNMEMTVQRLVELYAENNQTGFIGRYQGDGAPVLAEAFTRVKLG